MQPLPLRLLSMYFLVVVRKCCLFVVDVVVQLHVLCLMLPLFQCLQQLHVFTASPTWRPSDIVQIFELGSANEYFYNERYNIRYLRLLSKDAVDCNHDDG